jgi:hypothetical protein
MPEEIEEVEVDGVKFSYSEARARVDIHLPDRAIDVQVDSTTANALAQFFTQIRDRLEAEGL